MVTRVLDQGSRGGKPSWAQRLKVAAVAAGRRLAPALGIPGFCRSCGHRLEIVDDRLIDDSLICLRGVRLWRCPRCQQQSSERYSICPF